MKRRDAVRLLAGAALTGYGATGAFAQTSPITMATTPVDSAAEPYYGKDAGIFKAAGIDVELQSGALNGSAIAAAVAAGSLDAGVSNIVSIVQAHAKHIPFVIISPGGLYTHIAHAFDVPLRSERFFVQDGRRPQRQDDRRKHLARLAAIRNAGLAR